MITKIKIVGQPQGNFTIKSHLSKTYEKVIELPFKNFIVVYRTKSDAKDALMDAYIELKKDGAYMSKDHKKLYYDASEAYIN